MWEPEVEQTMLDIYAGTLTVDEGIQQMQDEVTKAIADQYFFYPLGYIFYHILFPADSALEYLHLFLVPFFFFIIFLFYLKILIPGEHVIHKLLITSSPVLRRSLLTGFQNSISFHSPSFFSPDLL